MTAWLLKRQTKLGVIQGIMPRINKSKGFKYYVVTGTRKKIFQRERNKQKIERDKMKKTIKRLHD